MKKYNNSIMSIEGLTFEKHLSSKVIQTRVQEMGKQISADLSDKNPVFICILKGAMFFFTDLLRNLSFMPAIDFLRVDSYDGSLTAKGSAKMLYKPTENIEGRHVVVVDDILDTGMTVAVIRRTLKDYKPESVSYTVLVRKQKSSNLHIKFDYCGFEIPDKFAVGYGLDYKQVGRNLNDIYLLKK